MQLIFWTRVPRRLEEGDIRLRAPRLADGPFLVEGLENTELLPQKYFGRHRSLSGLAVRRWARKTFVVSYIIEIVSRPIGLAGFHNITPGESAEMAVLIFNKEDRRRGYGSRTVAICIEALKRSFSIKRLIVEVEAGNIDSFLFLKRLGFNEFTGADDDRSRKMIRYLEKK